MTISNTGWHFNKFWRNTIWSFSLVYIKRFIQFINVTCACVWQIKFIFRDTSIFDFSKARWLLYTEIVSLTFISSWDASKEFLSDKGFSQGDVSTIFISCSLNSSTSFCSLLIRLTSFSIYLWNHWRYSLCWLKKV